MSASAQFRDSSSLVRSRLTWDGQLLSRDGVAYRSSFKPAQLAAPVSLMASGLLVHYFAHDTWDVTIRDNLQEWRGDGEFISYEDYLQYVPVAVDLGLAFTGIPSQHGFIDRLIESSLAYIFCAGLTIGSKYAFGTERPNGADNRSFPSGHTSLVFTGAELVRMEYGPWWGLGAYSVATLVGLCRMWHNAHWFSDVLMGAGIGILCAHIGGWLLEPFKSMCHIKTTYWGSGRHKPSLSFSPTVDSFSGALCASVALRF